MADRPVGSWLTVGLMVCLVTAIVLGSLRVSAAEREAIGHRARAVEMQRQREVAETILADMQARYTAQGDTLVILHEAVEATTREAQRVRLTAGLRGDSITALLRVSVGDSSAADSLVTALVVAHEDEVQAVETQLAVAMTENEALWRRVEASDDMLAQQVEVNARLREEVGAWQDAHAALSRDRFPSFLRKLTGNLEVAAVGIVIGAVAVGAIR